MLYELTDEEDYYLHGLCHLLTIALHRRTGLPPYATLDRDDWTEETVLVHAYVRDGEDGIDVRGRFDLDTIVDTFPTSRPFEVKISEQELILLGGGSPAVDETSGQCRNAAHALSTFICVSGSRSGRH